jgi:alpha-tubulin suppressor-like RCC1 family protein
VEGPALPLARVAAGGQHACVIDAVGAVFCWGSNMFGQLGSGESGANQAYFVQAVLSEPAAAIAAGGFHTCAVTSSGKLYCWGNGSAGQLGNGQSQSTTPVEVPGLSSVAMVSAGGNHTCAISSGSLHCWGSNGDGQLGVTGGNRSSPTGVSLTDPVHVSAGPKHTCAVAGADVYCWGANEAGQLGDASVPGGPTPRAVMLSSQGVNASAVAAGGHHSCAQLTNGNTRCWGKNTQGQLGIGSSGQASVAPTLLPDLSAQKHALGEEHSCAVVAGSLSACWGADDKGQVGDGSATGASSPFEHALSGVTDIATGTRFTCALAANGGALHCWGDNAASQLGGVAVAFSTSPVELPLLP